jgi:hypothetical protein
MTSTSKPPHAVRAPFARSKFGPSGFRRSIAELGRGTDRRKVRILEVQYRSRPISGDLRRSRGAQHTLSYLPAVLERLM